MTTVTKLVLLRCRQCGRILAGRNDSGELVAHHKGRRFLEPRAVYCEKCKLWTSA